MDRNRLILMGIVMMLWGAGCSPEKPAADSPSSPPQQSSPANAAPAAAPAQASSRPNEAASAAAAADADKISTGKSGDGSKSPKGKTVKTPSGLEYEDIVVGKGPMPKKGQSVSVDYIGNLSDGTTFDSSLNREPFTFALGQGNVIKGWDEGIATMRVGGQRFLTIPPALAYGPAGHPPKIPPQSTLTFLVSLRKIN
jgi:FKBP-type peptidyl-prolyl cis-trans isomerase